MKMKKQHQIKSSALILPLAFCLASTPVSAAVTYVDAVNGAAGNTFATGGSLATTSWINFTDSSNEDQDQWRLRPGSNRGVGDTIYHARTNGSDTIPELTVLLPGLADGTYNIYAFFWDDSSSTANTHNLDAGLTSGSLTTYGADNPLNNGATATLAPLASTLSYSGTNPTTIPDTAVFGNLNLHAALVGQAVVSSGSTISVFVDHSQSVTGLSSTAQVRSFFDGVGYEAVPEPSSTALLGLGGLALILRRRRI